MKRILKWDGEKIKEETTVEDKKHTPKDILIGLDSVRNQIGQMVSGEEKIKQQIETNKRNLDSARKFEKELAEFEDKCVELQVEKLKNIIAQVSDDLKAKAHADSISEIENDPMALDDNQKKQLPYLKYQKYLATHEKVANKIAPRIISKYLYEEPAFVNPFEDCLLYTSPSPRDRS